ncbi:hypothetical protein [Allocoleopsis sp.]|uniref:hypothetical protein n=1 Tax=Allocoleopsis sp. TaxID=3088169 RepID=UPI002FD07FE5
MPLNMIEFHDVISHISFSVTWYEKVRSHLQIREEAIAALVGCVNQVTHRSSHHISVGYEES